MTRRNIELMLLLIASPIVIVLFAMMVVTGGQDNTVTKTITDPIFEAAVNTKITTHLDVPRGTHSLGAGEFGNDSDVQNAVVEATVHFFADQMK